MAADLITYADKVETNVPSGNTNEIWTDTEQNEIKAVINSHAVDIDAVRAAIDIILRQSILTVDTVTSGKTINNNDYAKLFRCDNSTDFTFTIDTLNTIPAYSMIYFQRLNGNVYIDFDGAVSFGIKYSTDRHKIELVNGVAAVFKGTSNIYYVFGNLELP